jgi:predicted HNH restriction endonuclease
MKLCRKCGKTKENTFFFMRKRNNAPYGYCKECVTVQTMERLKTYKEQAILYLGGSCRLCGYNKYIGALEFHHLDPSIKDAKYSSMKNWSFGSKKDELDKCILLCANCHREVEAGIVKV